MVGLSDEELRSTAQRVWSRLYEEPERQNLIQAMGEFAVEAAAQFRDGNAILTPDALRAMYGPWGVVTLSLAFSTLIGPISPHAKRSARGLADQCAWPAQFGKAGRAGFTRAERLRQGQLAQECLDSAVVFLAAAERGPVDAIMHLLTIEAPDSTSYGPVNRVLVGLNWIAAWRLSTTYVDP